MSQQRSALLLGAGFVARPTLDILSEANVYVIVACRTLASAQKLCQGVKNAEPTSIDVTNEEQLSHAIARVDLVISLVPYIHHGKVICLAIRHKKNVVTTSYISKELEELNGDCKAAGITVLNEIGVDPGIDHLYAVKIIDEVHSTGGKVMSLRSFGGNLPAPENSDNPLGYKFSWAPRGVLLAISNAARYYQDGKLIELPGEELMANTIPYQRFRGFPFVVYPNRDSTTVKDRYQIPEVQTLLRGTLRYESYIALARALKKLGFLSTEKPQFLDMSVKSLKWKEVTQKVLQASSADESGLTKKICSHIKFTNGAEKDRVLAGLRWMGILSDEVVETADSILDMLCATLYQKMQYDEGERDLTILIHELDILKKDGTWESKLATLMDYGDPRGYSSIAKTVGVPCGVACLRVLDGSINEKGMLAPIVEHINKPLREDLEKRGISMTVKTFPFKAPKEYFT